MIYIILTFIEFILIINKMYFQTNSIYEKALVIEMKQKIWNVYTLYVQSVLRSL